MTATVKQTKADISQVNRAEIIDRQFINYVSTLKPGPGKTNRVAHDSPLTSNSQMSRQDFYQLFESQMTSRQLDLMARALRLENKVFYTIGSSGHEGNALVGRLLRHTDPAFLHYRSGAFMAERSRQLPGTDYIYNTALSFAASKEDPSSGGRHKVWGSKPLWVIPQTSTIASHLPKAVGSAIALDHTRALKFPPPIPQDSIMLCSFGDASVNHSTAQGAFNAAEWASFQHVPVPILFLCEDNSTGVSVPTPAAWVETIFRHRPCLKYFQADGLDLCAAYNTVKQAIDVCRRQRCPVFLHLKMVRLMGHAGTDIEIVYRSRNELELIEAQDPLLKSAKTAVEHGLMSAKEILSLYQQLGKKCFAAANKADSRPRLQTVTEITAPLAPYTAKSVQAEATRYESKQERLRVYGGENALPENQPPRHLAIQINKALTDLMIKYPQSLLFGEDVAKKGGVYTVTNGLAKTFRNFRVFNTLLDEQTILGMAQGYANMGMLPIAEIQYLAFFHNACDQIRGEAASLQFFSDNHYQNPMVVRIAGLGYQKGFGGHFHNDNSIAALRDIPGIIVACPSRGDDAAMMLRTLMALAKVNGRVSLFIEPIALYMTKDLHRPNDEGWCFKYPPPNKAIPLGQIRIYHPKANDLLIISYANGIPMSLRAIRQIELQSGKKVRLLDLRWLHPLNKEQIVKHASACNRILVVDEGRQTGSVSEGVITTIVEALGQKVKISRVVGADSYTPLGMAAPLILPSEKSITDAAVKLLSEE